MPNPKPLEPVGTFSGEGAVVQTNSRGIKNANFLQPDRRMARVALEELKILVGQFADVVRELPMVKPEVRISEVLQSGVQRPAS